MAIRIKPLRKFTTGTPTTSDMVEGELAVNTFDQKIWVRDNANNIVEVGNAAGRPYGIADTNAVQINHASVADDDYAKFTASGLEGRSYSEVLTDIGAQATLTFGIADTNAVKIDSATVADDKYARFTSTGLEGRSTSEVLSDIGAQASLDFGISNGYSVVIDDASVVDDEYAKFTATGIEGRSYAEVKTDLVLNNVENTALSTWAGTTNITTIGDLTGITVDGDATFKGNSYDMVWDKSNNSLDFAASAKTTWGSQSTLSLKHSGAGGNAYFVVSEGNFYFTSNANDCDIIFSASDDGGSTGTDPYLILDGGLGEAQLYHSPSGLKLATKSTGVTVTGNTVTTNLLVDDGGNIGSATATSALTIAADGTIVHNIGSTNDSTTTPAFTIESTHDDQYTGPFFSLYRNSASPADNDGLGTILFQGEDSAGAKRLYSQINGKIKDATDSLLKGAVYITTKSGGASKDFRFGYGLDDGFDIPDGGYIGSSSDPDAISIGNDGDVTLTQDLELQHDGAILSFGTNNEIALTHVHDTGLVLTDSGGTPTLQLHDSNESVSSDGTNLILTSGGTAFKLPTADGSADHVIKTDGGGNLSFVAQSGGGGAITALNNATANELVTVGSTTTELDAETLLTWDASTEYLGVGIATVTGIPAGSPTGVHDAAFSNSLIHIHNPNSGNAGSGIKFTRLGGGSTIDDGSYIAINNYNQFILNNLEDAGISLVANGNLTLEAMSTGVVKISDAFTLPSSDGSAGQQLQTDGNGVVTWEAAGGGGGDITTDTAWAAKGDLIIATANNAASVLSLGSNTHVLTADSSEATGVKWAAVSGGGGASVTIQETAPGSASAGDMWFDSSDDSGNLKIYYNDGGSSQWIESFQPLASRVSTATLDGTDGGSSNQNSDILLEDNERVALEEHTTDFYTNNVISSIIFPNSTNSFVTTVTSVPTEDKEIDLAAMQTEDDVVGLIMAMG